MIRGRWKVACINWSHPDAPHAMSYLLVTEHDDEDLIGSMVCEMPHATWAEAMQRVGRMVKAVPAVAVRRILVEEPTA